MKKTIFINQICTIIVFFTILISPLFQDVTHVFSLQKLEGENRAKAEKPAIDIKQLDAFPAQYSKYYNDNFSFRTFFYNFDYRIFLKKSPISQVIIGKNKTLYSGGKEAKVYQGLFAMSNEDISKIIKKLENRMAQYKEMGIHFYVTIAPTSLEIYPENLPFYFLRAKETATDKFLKAIKDTDIPCIYLKEALLKNKTAGQLYNKLDNHWNELGCFYAYCAIMDVIKTDFPQLPSYSFTDFELTPEYKKWGNLINMLSENYKKYFDEDAHYSVQLIDSNRRWHGVPKAGYPPLKEFPYPSIYEVTGECALPEMPRIVIIRDSYFNSVIPFIYNSFSRSVAIFDSWYYKDNINIVSQEKPQIVLLVIYEPHISNINTYD